MTKDRKPPPAREMAAPSTSEMYDHIRDSATSINAMVSSRDVMAQSTIRYPAWLTEDAPKAPFYQRSIEPPERIDLLAEVVNKIRWNDGNALPMKVGVLYVLANQHVRRHNVLAREFSYVEFKAVVRCMVLDSARPFGIAAGKIYENRGSLSRLSGIAKDEEEVVRQVREGMEEVYEPDAARKAIKKEPVKRMEIVRPRGRTDIKRLPEYHGFW
ncbi:hypothetical protein CLAFUW4_05621 [Fulvia fulva]|uniref:Uncharacterized protein n=1 Tax=Passalora fulva TaxID=5499 RepID=A0A9Q8P8S4_PASFU|nr:uncharacterized protein CLAFUR5_05762 [Fulvia fulva]KAK4623553.1 hypothetical protein CLAFUR4_05616 [Fulvia fulva]KAK4625910.1 hypothetical protein CLAFUR0_05624 [Fulvia fulva]UJO17206.1 hypothetical protein CLAFUR5_05762 [Fulvia fulva]WPV14819.1 hypothetical protein CLAFUW4_05621 [Fulvia fulva]WPV29795.1 hypothetical protein CLAFUW7_05620 [Fulvia fulva]